MRVDSDGRLIRLADQDRHRWDRDLIAEGQQMVRQCLHRNSPGPYQWQTAIAAVHSDAADATQTDWAQIRALYDQLLAAAASPVVEVNRAVAVLETDGPDAALRALDALTESPAATQVTAYQRFHATRAEVLARLGRVDEARDAYDEALAPTGLDHAAVGTSRRCCPGWARLSGTCRLTRETAAVSTQSRAGRLRGPPKDRGDCQ